MLRGVRWRFFAHGLPAAIWGGVLLALAVAPSLGPIEDIQLVSHQDKLSHFAEYVVLAFLTAFALVRATKRSRQWRLLWAFAAPAAYGVLLELLQLLVPARDPSVLDGAANVLGALVGALLGMGLLERWAR